MRLNWCYLNAGDGHPAQSLGVGVKLVTQYKSYTVMPKQLPCWAGKEVLVTWFEKVELWLISVQMLLCRRGLNVAKLVIRTERLGTNKKTLRSLRSHLSSTWRGLLQKDNGAKTLGVVPRPLAKEERTKCGTYIIYLKVGCLLHTRSATDVTIRFCSRGCGSSEK